jgi:hypothetical protein
LSALETIYKRLFSHNQRKQNTIKMNKEELINYLISIIEQGSDKDILDLYNAYTGENLTIEQIKE